MRMNKRRWWRKKQQGKRKKECRKRERDREKQVLRICFRFRLENATRLDANGGFSFALHKRNAFSHIYADDLLSVDVAFFCAPHLFSLCIILLLSFGVNWSGNWRQKGTLNKMISFFLGGWNCDFYYTAHIELNVVPRFFRLSLIAFRLY